MTPEDRSNARAELPRNQEDFTLLHLSGTGDSGDSSDSGGSSSADHLFGYHNHHHHHNHSRSAHHLRHGHSQPPLMLNNAAYSPGHELALTGDNNNASAVKKKRVRQKRRPGQSYRLNGTGSRRGSNGAVDPSNPLRRSQSYYLFAQCGGMNVIYALLLVLLLWSASLSWMTFSLRAQLINSRLILSDVEREALDNVTSVLGSINQTMDHLKSNYSDLSERLAKLQAQLNTAIEKNLSSTDTKVEGIAVSTASIGSRMDRLEDQVKKVEGDLNKIQVKPPVEPDPGAKKSAADSESG